MATQAEVEWQTDAESKASQFGLLLTGVPPDGSKPVAAEMWLIRRLHDSSAAPSQSPADWFGPVPFGDTAVLESMIQLASGRARDADEADT